MRFHFGPIPELPTFQPKESGWQSLKEPTPWVAQLLSVPIALALVGGLSVGWWGIKPLHPDEIAKAIFLIFPALIVLLPFHESIHLALQPGAGRSDRSILGFWPSKLLVYSHYEGSMPRNHFIRMALAPLVAISVVPLVCAYLTQTSHWALFCLSVTNALASSVDVFGALAVFVQVPQGALVRNKGYYTWWTLNEPLAVDEPDLPAALPATLTPAQQHQANASVLAAGLTGLLFGIAGLLLLTLGRDGSDGLGYLVFGALPVTCGLAVGAVVSPQRTVAWSVGICVVLGLPGLVALKLEGLFCTVMALPLIVPPLIVGAVVGRYLRRRQGHPEATPAIVILATALFVGTAGVDRAIDPVGERQSVATEAVVSGTPVDTWNLLLTVDAIQVKQPWLMRLGLPVPRRCTLAGYGLGARRVCYFDQGEIEEEIVAWEPGRLLGMRIIRSTLPGRGWLSFETAEYRLTQLRLATRIVRTTTIRSMLRPRWYWSSLEALGVETEHKYLLAEIARQAAEEDPGAMR